jgi:hypothetical protein
MTERRTNEQSELGEQIDVEVTAEDLEDVEPTATSDPDAYDGDSTLGGLGGSDSQPGGAG